MSAAPAAGTVGTSAVAAAAAAGHGRPGPWLGLAPALLTLGCFMVAPMAVVLVYSFLERNPTAGVIWRFSTDAYTGLLFERQLDGSLAFTPIYLVIILRSMALAALTALLSLLVGFPAAWWIAGRPQRQRAILVFLVTLPFWTNLLIRTFAWILILRDDGLLNNALRWLGLTDRPLAMLYTWGATSVGLLYSYIPFMVLPIYVAVERLDRRLLEAAHDLYAGPWAALRHVALPLARPGIVAGCVLVFVPAMGAFLAADLLGGGRHLMIGNLVGLQFRSARNWPFGAALAMVLLAIVLVALMLLARRARAVGEAHS